MKPIFDTRSKWRRVRALGQRGLVILSLFFCLGVAQADTTNFTGAFDETFWNMQPQFGSVYFTNGGKELVLAGPNQPTEAVPQSLDGVVYNGPLGGGLVVGGTVSFHWEYNSGDALSDSEGDIAWTPPGGTSIQSTLGQGGPSVFQFGDFPPTFLSQGTTNLTFLLTTDTLANKLSGTLIITDFQFHEEVPEPSTLALLAGGLTLALAAQRHRSRRGTSGLQ
jgi:hypothetical protein